MVPSRTIRHGGARTGRRRGGVLALFAAGLLLLSACTGSSGGPGGGSDGGGAAGTSGVPVDPALASACADFWGDPDYDARLVRDVLDRIATASQDGAGDPYFYSLTADDIDAAFADAPEEARAAAGELSAWFRDRAPQGADPDSARPALAGVATACAGTSAGAHWFIEPDGEPGGKPSALVCADVYDTPSTYLIFGNANVLTSNMFQLVGLSGRIVPQDRMDEVQAVADHLEAEAERADDPAVAEALRGVRAPFEAALDGNTAPGGLEDELAALGTACRNAGYDAPTQLDENPSAENEDTLV